MIARVQQAMQKRAQGEKGFTLIELLVVIIIIGILAAIAIPAFLNQRTKAWVSQVESDLKNAAIAAESYAVDNNGSYTGLQGGTQADGSGLEDNGFNPTQDVTVAVTPAADGNSYELTGTNANITGRSWTYDSATGVITENTATP